MNVIALMPPLSLIKLLCSSVPNYTNYFLINTNFMIGNLFVVLYLLFVLNIHFKKLINIHFRI